VKDLNISKTAQRIFVSQQNLSHHIQRLEEYYGVQLFLRKPKLALTYAGEQLLVYAQKTTDEDSMIRSCLLEINEKNQGILRIGATTPRASIFIPPVVEEFHKTYPHVRFDICTQPSTTLEHMVAEKKLDMAIGMIFSHIPDLISYHLISERVYLLVSEDLIRQYYGSESDNLIAHSKLGAQIENFALLPFAFPDSSVNLERVLRSCFTDANCQPNILLSTIYPQFFLPLAFDGLAAFFITQMIYHNIKNTLSPNMHIFPLLQKGQIILRDISITINKKRYLPPYAEYFIRLIQNYFYMLDQDHL
jgi:DNA-binding transcriptional LysR family regulator